MSIPTTPCSDKPSSVGATATSGDAGVDAAATVGGSVTATHPVAQASTPSRGRLRSSPDHGNGRSGGCGVGSGGPGSGWGRGIWVRGRAAFWWLEEEISASFGSSKLQMFAAGNL